MRVSFAVESLQLETHQKSDEAYTFVVHANGNIPLHYEGYTSQFPALDTFARISWSILALPRTAPFAVECRWILHVVAGETLRTVCR